MSKKLLHKTTGSFLTFSVLILVVSAPLFYYISHWLYVYETDEVLIFHKNAFLKKDLKRLTEQDIRTWSRFNRDVEILPGTTVSKDSIFGIIRFDSIANEMMPFRELHAPIKVNGKDYTYVERNNLVEMEDMVYAIAFMFFIMIALLLIGVMVLSKRLAETVWSPFYDTLRQIQNFEIDKNNTPVFAATDVEEFDTLNKSIDKLVEKNRAIYQSQREFVENAAHELQTPLALFQTKLDTLSQSNEISPEISGIISSLNNDVARMNRLNKNLLLLSKIDNDSYFEKQPLTLNELIEKNLGFFTEQARSRSINVVLDIGETAVVETNPVLAEVLINNLFLNAIRHNVAGGQVAISTTHRSVTFSNTGTDHSLDSEKLFNRFSKADPSAQGNGLGLAIIKKITDLNGWDIRYAFIDGQHTFNVTF